MFSRANIYKNRVPVIPWTHNFLDSLVRQVKSSGNPKPYFRTVRFGRYCLSLVAGESRFCDPQAMLSNPKDYASFEVWIEDWADPNDHNYVFPYSIDELKGKYWVEFFKLDGNRGRNVPVDVIRHIILDLEGMQLKENCGVKK